MPPSSPTTNLSPAVPNISASPTPPPTYRVRTMASDLDVAKKGGGTASAAASAPVPVKSNVLPANLPAVSRPALNFVEGSNPPARPASAPDQIRPAFPAPIKPVAPKEPAPVFSFKSAAPPPQPFSAPLGRPYSAPPSPKTSDGHSEATQGRPITPPPPTPQPTPSQTPMPPSFSIPPRPTPYKSFQDSTGPATPPPPPTLPISPIPPRPTTLAPIPPPLSPLKPIPTAPITPPVPPPAGGTRPPTGNLPSLPLLGPAKPKKKKLILLLALAVVALALIGGEIWWFFLRTEPTPPPADLGQTLPPPENAPLLPPPENIPPPVTTSPETETTQPAQATPGLLLYTDLILSGDPTKAGGLVEAATEIAGAGLGEGEIKRLIFSPTGEPDTTAGFSFDNLLSGLKIKMPTAVKNELMESEFDIFAFGGTDLDRSVCEQGKNMAAACHGPRLGLVFDVSANGKTKLESALRAWEKTMVSDLKPLILARTGTLTGFKTGTYQDQTIRYQNLPLNTVTLDYAVVDDLLIITTSKSAMLKAIDSVPAPGEG